VIDWGDHDFDIGCTEGMMASVEASTATFLEAGCFPMTMGGDHLVTYPLLKAVAKQHGKGLSLVHFDAHTDTSKSDKLNHGTMFWHAMRDGLIDPGRSIHTGIRMAVGWDDGFDKIGGWDAARLPAKEIGQRIRDVVGKNKAYLTFDIDFLDPAYAPGTGTPVVGGPTTMQALDILMELRGINFVGMDLVEVAPEHDNGEITSLAGASMMYHVLHLLAENRPVVSASRTPFC
tara:strand:+ start:1700 stop:2395 length:696 start_codon:yes stop_codon:yes gene_type:complete